ncbi:hypothetical protein FRC06_007549 [Ceratobasidium sp. 370]|nr:hypothetical protein FRC06_007549 [Ceratobasidium sp. 370]
METWVILLLVPAQSGAVALVSAAGRARHVGRARAPRDLPVGRPITGPSPRVSTRDTHIQKPLPDFELVYGLPAEYALGRALESAIQVKGRPLNIWPYDAQPDLSDFSWMRYERTRRVLGGTPPALQPAPVPANTLSYINVYVFVGGNQGYTVRTTLGISIRSVNASAPLEPAPSPTLSPAAPVVTLASSPPSVSGLHGPILAIMIAACALLLVLVLGGLSWLLAMRRHLKEQCVSDRHAGDNAAGPRGRSRTARWPRTTAHSLSFAPPSHGASAITTSTRRRVRTVDHGSPTTTSNQPSLEPVPASPGKPVESRKRAATLLHTIHTRAIRGSPRIGSSKGTLSPDLSSRRGFVPRASSGQASPRIGTRIKREELPKVEQTRRDEFTNSWCSALHMDPFQSPGASVGLDDNGKARQADIGASPTMESGRIAAERPMSPTPEKVVWGIGHRTMSLSELRGSLAEAGLVVDSSGGLQAGEVGTDSGGVSPTAADSNQEGTPTPRASQIHATATSSEDSLAQKRLERHETYAERTSQIGMALFTSPPETRSPKNTAATALGLSFDSFFSPKSAMEEDTFEEEAAEPRYRDVASERMVRIAPSQETMATTYVTAPESGTPNTLGDRSSSAGHGQPEIIGVIGSPSTGHSRIVELDDIPSPLLTEPDVEKTEVSNQSLSVGYAGADQSLRVLDSFPGMLRGSLSHFPEDVEVNTPVIPSISRAALSYRESMDILLLPEEDLDQGCIRLARVASVERQNRAGDQSYVGNESTSQKFRGNASTEDSIISPNLSGQKSTRDDSILSRTKSDESADSLEVGDSM